jgi:hypothetical protein
MSETINAASIQNLFNDTSLSNVNAEIILNAAIKLLNTFHAEIPVLTGTAGSKTLNATYAEAGAIETMAREIYAKPYKNASGNQSVGVGGISMSFLGDNQLLEVAKRLASELREIDVSYG